MIPLWTVPFAALVMATGSVWNTLVSAPDDALVVLLVTAAAIVLAPRFPVQALGLIVLSAIMQFLLGVEVNPAQVFLGAALYSIGRHGSRFQHRLALAVVVVFGVLQIAATVREGSKLLDAVFSAARLPLILGVVTVAVAGVSVLVVPLLAGIARQARVVAGADESARRRAEAELGASRVVAAVEADRARMARDVHDTVGHALTVVITQTRVLAAVAARDPAMVVEAAAAVEKVASAALDEVRGVLAGSVQVADVTVEDLVELASSTDGVRVRVDGDIAPLRGDIGEAAYRAVQELVTNALRHGDRDEPVQVSISAQGERLELEVSNAMTGDTGTSLPSAASSGLSGLRARLDAVSGVLETTSRACVWSTRVEIPLRHP